MAVWDRGFGQALGCESLPSMNSFHKYLLHTHESASLIKAQQGWRLHHKHAHTLNHSLNLAMHWRGNKPLTNPAPSPTEKWFMSCNDQKLFDVTIVERFYHYSNMDICICVSVKVWLCGWKRMLYILHWFQTVGNVSYNSWSWKGWKLFPPRSKSSNLGERGVSPDFIKFKFVLQHSCGWTRGGELWVFSWWIQTRSSIINCKKTNKQKKGSVKVSKQHFVDWPV